MKVYLVGGAVRDQLLNAFVNERDWVVVGATANQLLHAGFKQVGKDFPVFLHPKTKEEYALARTEKKIADGHDGFLFNTQSNVTLEEDLSRRDLTINAMAMDEQQNLIDPYGGLFDLEHKILRHVSPAFREDPLRILRVARFAARFHHLGFTIHPGTLALMKHMSASGELKTLSPERIWQEWQKSLCTDNPDIFFEVLFEVDAIECLYPKDRMPQFQQGLAHFKAIFANFDDPVLRFAAVMKHLLTDAESSQYAKVHRIPLQYMHMTRCMLLFDDDITSIQNMDAESILLLLNQLDVFRKPQHWPLILALSERSDTEKQLWQKACVAAQSVCAQPFVEQGLKGRYIKQALKEARLQSIGRVLE